MHIFILSYSLRYFMVVEIIGVLMSKSHQKLRSPHGGQVRYHDMPYKRLPKCLRPYRDRWPKLV